MLYFVLFKMIYLQHSIAKYETSWILEAYNYSNIWLQAYTLAKPQKRFMSVRLR